ncbi:MAG: hypothetical protein AAGH15_09840 [Myxococcota bacterium]
MEIFGQFVLLAYVPFALLVFFQPRSAAGGVIRTVIWGTCFLPETAEVDLPFIPAFNKSSMIGISCWLGVLWKAPHRLRQTPAFRGYEVFFVISIIGMIATVYTNRFDISEGRAFRPALTLYDLISEVLALLVSVFLVFRASRTAIRRRKDMEDLSKVLVQAGLIYTLGALIELRLSPQLHYWVYGESPQSFLQVIRFGGYRPLVFMETGMAVGMFFVLTSLMAMARATIGRGDRRLSLWLAAILVAVKSTGAVLYGIVLLPLAAMKKRKRTGLIPLSIAIIVMVYPFTRSAEIFPDKDLVKFVTDIDAERGESIWFRFDQESQILKRTRENNFAFGWGPYARSHIFLPWDGRDMTVLDGHWIIILGDQGVVGFLCVFLTLCIPLVRAGPTIKKLEDRDTRTLFWAIACGAAVYILDLLPNGLFNDLPYFLTGAVAGLSPGLLAEQKRRKRWERRQEKRARYEAEEREAAERAAAQAAEA